MELMNNELYLYESKEREKRKPMIALNPGVFVEQSEPVVVNP